MIDQFLTRLAATMASLVVAMLVLVAALGYLAYAAYLALLGVLSPPLAALTTGAGAILVAFLIVALARVLTRPKRARARRRDGADEADAAERLAGEIGGKLGEQIGALTRAHKGPVLAASLLAGVAVGASPRLRGALLDLMQPR
jgi:hypothetical protein